MKKFVLLSSIWIAGTQGVAMAQTIPAAQISATARLEASKLDGPRQLEQQTAAAAIRDYLESWQSLHSALEQNQPELLDRDFVGTARDKLAGTIQEQSRLGVKTSYQDRQHDLKIAFYSPDGLSIELTDDAEYDVQVTDHDKVQFSKHEHARYVVVLTPSELRWRVRVFEATPEP